MHNNVYLKDLIKKVNEKREQSIAEFPLTDLNNGTLDDVHKWYDSLLKLVKSKPPDKFVRTIVIEENDMQIIKNINYIFSDVKDDILAITILMIP